MGDRDDAMHTHTHIYTYKYWETVQSDRNERQLITDQYHGTVNIL